MNRRPCRASLSMLLLLVTTCAASRGAPPATAPAGANDLYARDNLVAWCIVPFDAKKRGPEDRAAMLERLGFRHFAYDWRAEHLPTFDAEIDALARHHVELSAVWFPARLDADARLILDTLKRRGLKPELWVSAAGRPLKDEPDDGKNVEAAAAAFRPVAEAAAKIGCAIGLYNHGGWLGEPENMLAILDRINLPNVGIVYNLHHGHDHVDRLKPVLDRMRPHLLCVNLNGTQRGGDKVGNKILPLGQGDLDVELLRTIRDSGYRGRIGILNHTDEDAEGRLLDNLDGLAWLVPQLDGAPAGPAPALRTYRAGPAPTTATTSPATAPAARRAEEHVGQPPPRTRAEVEAVVGTPPAALDPAKLRKLTVVLVAGPKDHGLDQHDYPAWYGQWLKQMEKSPLVLLAGCMGHPSQQVWDGADLIVFYCWGEQFWDADTLKQVDAYLARGGGLVLLHSAVIGKQDDPQALADRIGYAWTPKGTQYRHGHHDLTFTKPDHPITRGFTKLHVVDEDYWPILATARGAEKPDVLATTPDDGGEWPVAWTFQRGKGRVFCTTLGHYTWTLDDPLVRTLIGRGMAWAADQPIERFRAAVLDGAAVSDGPAW